MIAREGYSTIAITVVISVFVCYGASFISHWSAYVIYGVMILLTALIIFFFRDPERSIPEDENLVIAPADGKIVKIDEVDEDVYLNSRARQVSIFLSPLDVHVNRVPATGKIEYVKYHPGAYLMAWDHRASEMNERADFGLMHPSQHRIFFRQITGFLARRIVYRLNRGDEVKAGDRFGMMKFGSRMDILVPLSVEIHVREGERTVGGETVLGTIPE